MPEDTKSLRAGFSSDEFLARRGSLARRTQAVQVVLDRFTGGLLFYYFGNVDQVAHMMWRARDPQHPAYDPFASRPREDG